MLAKDFGRDILFLNTEYLIYFMLHIICEEPVARLAHYHEEV